MRAENSGEKGKSLGMAESNKLISNSGKFRVTDEIHLLKACKVVFSMQKSVPPHPGSFCIPICTEFSQDHVAQCQNTEPSPSSF